MPEGSTAARLALWKHHFHQAQALIVTHLRPARNLGGVAKAAQAKAIVVEFADTDAGAEHGAERNIHPETFIASHRSRRDDAGMKPASSVLRKIRLTSR